MGNVRRPRMYLRNIQLISESVGSEDTMAWVWMGENPVGKDWNLGGVRLFTLAEAMAEYGRRLRRAGVEEVSRG